MRVARRSSIGLPAVSIVLFALTPVLPVLGQKSSGQAQFQGSMETGGSVSASSNFSPDGQAVTVLFDDLAASLGGQGGEPLVATRVATLQFPLSGSAQGVRFKLDIRGFADVDPGAFASLVVQSGGQTRTYDLSNIGDDYSYTFDTTLSANASDLAVTFAILAQRSTTNPDLGFNVRVDAFDASIRPITASPICCPPCPPRYWRPRFRRW